MSEVMRLAKLEANTQIESQLLGLLTDPVWAAIAGFVAVHELRKQNLIGPVADDILYAGIITISAARQPALTDLAGRGLSAVAGAGIGAAAGGAVGAGGVAAGGAAGGGAAVAGGGAAGMSLVGTAGAVGGGILTSAGAMKAVELALPPEVRKEYKKLPLWKRYLIAVPGFQGTMSTLLGARLFGKKKKKK